jgi:anti-anti-sigma regulatory factor
MRLQTTADEELGLLMVTPTGGLDERSADALCRVFDAAVTAGHLRVLVDLTGLDDVDPAVAATFLEQDERLTALGGWLWLVHGTAELGAALRSAGVTTRVRTSRRLPVPQG